MSDEEDYMSDKFLASLTDERPSLIHDRAKKRQLDVQTKQKEHRKRQRQAQLDKTGHVNSEKLKASLQTPLTAENKGFQLLAKMGYKAGQALGKPVNVGDESGSGLGNKRLVEPIGITLKSDRGGLGREAALRELAEKRQQLRLERLRRAAGLKEEVSTDEFRKRAMQKAEGRFMHGALKRCQLTCENLDHAAKVEMPEMNWFWPERLEESKEAEEEEAETANAAEEQVEETEEFTDSEKMDMLTQYLRTSYTFCFWCGVQYTNAEDLSDNCPGLLKDDH